MNAVDMNAGAAKLHLAAKLLRQRWDEATEHWDDAARRHFEEQYLAPLDPAVITMLEAIGRLGQVFIKAQDECCVRESE